MSVMARRTRLLVCFIIGLAPVALGAQQAQRPVRGGTLVLAGVADLQGMNSLVANESYTREFLQYVIGLPLLRLRPDLTYEPALAQSWTLLGDTGVVFRLRRDVFWHDGRRTSAHDVAFTFRRAQDKDTGFANADYFSRWRSVQVLDSFTVRFKFEPHVDPLIGWAFTAPMPMHLLDSIPSARLRQAAFNRNPVGNGPFRFVSARANDRWVFEANPRFPAALGGRPYVDRLIWRVIPDNTSRITELVTGNVDVAFAPRALDLKQLATNPDIRPIVKPSRRYAMITWNGKRPPFTDARVRRALLMALDRIAILNTTRGGYGQLATGPINPFHWAYDRSLSPLPFDTAGARALLAAAGYRDRNGDRVLEDASGKELAFELKIPAGSALNQEIAELARGQLQRIGVRVTTRSLDFATLIADVSSPERRFDAALLSFDSDFRINLRDSFHSAALAGPFQSASYSNPEMDALIDRAAVVTNRAVARGVYRRIQQIFLRDQPVAILWYQPDLILVRQRVRNTPMDIRGSLVNITRWWLAR